MRSFDQEVSSELIDGGIWRAAAHGHFWASGKSVVLGVPDLSEAPLAYLNPTSCLFWARFSGVGLLF